MKLQQRQPWTIVVSALLCVFTSACGGGGNSSSSSGSPPPNPSFTISLSPTTLTLTQGAAGQVLQVSISGQNGFTGTVTITISALPTGVTAAPSSLSITPNTPGSLTLSASSNAEISEQSVTVTGVSGASNITAPLQLTVTGTAPPDPFHVVGGATVHGFFDESRQLLFATNIGLNEVDVISSTNPFSVQTRVPVPQPIGIDQMADGNTLVIGTAAQELVTVDEDTFAVTQYPFSEVGTGGFTLFFPTVVALANGNVIVIGQEQGVDSNDIVDGGQYLYVWNSNANTFTQLEPTSNNVPWETDSLARSADHKWAAFAGDQFYLYSSDSYSLTSAPLGTVDPPDNEFGVRGYAINSDGSEIAVASASQVTFLNNSLAVLGTAPIPGAFQLSRTEVQFSADDTKLYLQYDLPLQVQVIDPTTYTPLGYLSATVIPDDDNLERMLATDSEGRGYFGINGGVRILNLTQPLVPNGSNGMQVPICPNVTASLPLNVSQQQELSNTFSGVSIFVGGQAAPLLNGGTAISVPASSAVGPVDVLCVASSGDTAVFADGVSYGVEPIAFSANLLPPSGNPTAYLFGFGFSGQDFETPNVSVGGVSATSVTNLQGLEPGVLQGVVLQVPNGSSGQDT